MNSELAKAISHHTSSKVPYTTATKKLVENIKNRLKNSDNLFLPLDDTLDILDELAQFDLGRFLLHNKGLNGYWTSYVFKNSENDKARTPLETWLLNKSLLVLARERFEVFQKLIQKELRSNINVASIPCGLMDDLLLLEYLGLENVKLIGIDADEESLMLAKKNSLKRNLQENTSFVKRDAWNLEITEKYDIITSNGLNMYESKEERLIELYKNFNRALKPNGVLIISFLPPPPSSLNLETIANIFNMTCEDWKKERAIFSDIIEINYLNFCTEEKMRYQLKCANFIVKEVVYNEKGVLPVLVAGKVG